MLQVENLKKTFGQRVLFENSGFSIGSKERIGLVGRNGSGKSTLFKILMGEETADQGDIRTPRNYRIGYLKQHLSWSYPTVLSECASALEKNHEHETYRVEKILFGLGFKKEDLERDPRSFSGGQQIRFNLCKVLVQSPDLLLLDEPTNYLDIVSIRWLSRFLLEYPGALILITHDRTFMDNICNSVMGIHRARLRLFRGNSENFYQKLSEEEEVYQQTKENQEKKIKKTQEFINRFRAKARQASLAQSRMKMLEKMKVLESLDSEDSLDFNFNYKDCPGKTLLDAKSLSFSWTDENQDLFSNLNFNLNKGERLGVIGKNGKGKSTFLNALAGHLSFTQGQVQLHPSVEMGFFGQTNVNRLTAENSIAQEILSVNPHLTHTQVRSIAGTMMFSGEQADKKIKVLSGGEKSRVLLGKILAAPCNVLLLDEPTNHLDQESVESLIEGIREFPGGVIVVTHNEELLQEICDKLIIFRENDCSLFEGTYADFLNKVGWEEDQVSEEKNQSLVKAEDLSPNSRVDRGKLIFEKNQKLKPIREKIKKIEKVLNPLEVELKREKDALIEASVKGDGAEISRISKKLPGLENQVENLIEELLLLEEEKEAIEENFKKL